MCLIIFAVAAEPATPLVVVANRDEYHRRLTAPAAFWDDHPQVVAGRDLQGGGSWLGITTRGRFAAVTNYREPDRQRLAAPSRGALVADFLSGEAAPAKFVAAAATRGDHYNGFNLLLGDQRELWYLSNRGGPPQRLGPGVYGLSNHLLDTPWPKVRRGRRRLAALLASQCQLDLAALAAIADDRNPAPDGQLPDTGVPLAWERLLSAPLIVSPDYGTRSTTVLVRQADGRVRLVEHSRDVAGEVVASHSFDFDLAAPSRGL